MLKDRNPKGQNLLFENQRRGCCIPLEIPAHKSVTMRISGALTLLLLIFQGSGVAQGTRPDLVIDNVSLSISRTIDLSTTNADRYSFIMQIRNVGELPFIEDITISWRTIGSLQSGLHIDRGSGRKGILMPGGELSLTISTAPATRFEPGSLVRFTIEPPNDINYRKRYEESSYENNTLEYVIPTPDGTQ